MTINKLRKRSNEFVRNIDVHIAIAVQDSEPEIIKQNTRQMLNSELSDGSPILPKYSDAYAKRKGFRNPNLRLSGDFQNDMFLTTNENDRTYFVSSLDFKTPFLVEKYTLNVFGLTDKSLKVVRPVATKKLAEFYKQKVL